MSQNHRGLRLDVSLNRDAFESSMNATYRKEGLSVGSDHMRLYGEDVQMEVSFADLVMGERIGQGACSAVNLARHKRTNDIYAIKMFNVADQGQESQLYNEIFLLTSFQCDALIALKGVFHNQGCIGIIIEYMDQGSLEFILQPEIRMKESVMAAIAFQIIWGLGYLHYEKQIHRDIKPANILMNSRGEVKLSDFGISKELDSSTAMSHTAVGSYRYMSPERLLGEKYDASGDIWSVGITIVQLWTKNYPFSSVADTPIDLFGELEHFNFDRVVNKTDFPPLMRKFIRSTLATNPDKRADCGLLAGSQWFEECGVNSLVDAHEIVRRWLVECKSQQHHRAPHSNNGKPPRRDENQMSISLDNSKASLASSTSSGHNMSNSHSGQYSSARHRDGIGDHDHDISNRLSNVMEECEYDEYGDDQFEAPEGDGEENFHRNKQQPQQKHNRSENYRSDGYESKSSQGESKSGGSRGGGGYSHK